LKKKGKAEHNKLKNLLIYENKIIFNSYTSKNTYKNARKYFLRLCGK
jgi:hypothetical protein